MKTIPLNGAQIKLRNTFCIPWPIALIPKGWRNRSGEDWRKSINNSPTRTLPSESGSSERADVELKDVCQRTHPNWRRSSPGTGASLSSKGTPWSSPIFQVSAVACRTAAWCSSCRPWPRPLPCSSWPFGFPPGWFRGGRHSKDFLFDWQRVGWTRPGVAAVVMRTERRRSGFDPGATASQRVFRKTQTWTCPAPSTFGLFKLKHKTFLIRQNGQTELMRIRQTQWNRDET